MHKNNFSLVTLAMLLLALSCRPKDQSAVLHPEEATPALEYLMEGNRHFAGLHPQHPDEDEQRLKAAAKGQHPFAVIVSCSDSRVSPELIFDQGIGDLFVVRTAGNILTGVELGSIEYAVEHLGAKLVVILGHEKCGAVKAFVDGGEADGHIREIVDSLKAEKEIKDIPVPDSNYLEDCVKANVLHGMRQVSEQSAIIREKLEAGEIRLVGARYDLDNQQVTIVKNK